MLSNMCPICSELAEYKCIYALGIARSMFNIYKCMSNIHPTWVCLAAVFVFALFLYALCLTPSPPPLPLLRSNILYFLEPTSHRRSRLCQPSFMQVKVNSHVRTKSRDGSSGGGDVMVVATAASVVRLAHLRFVSAAAPSGGHQLLPDAEMVFSKEKNA